jgi:parallel beta-helix repeat protein
MHSAGIGLFLSYGAGTANVNMSGGSISNYDPWLGGWAGVGWGGNVNWNQTGGTANIFVISGGMSSDAGTLTNMIVNGGLLYLIYHPTIGSGNLAITVGGNGTVKLDDASSVRTSYTVNPGGTIKVSSSAWTTFQNAVSYNGTPVFLPDEGSFKVVTAVPGPESNIWSFTSLDDFASHWLDQNCFEPDWCNGWDLDHSKTVTFKDFSYFAKRPPLACHYYVSPSGSDNNPGTLIQPFATFEKARNTIRGSLLPQGGVTVYIRGGKYFRTTEFDLTSQDCGTSDKPIVYCAYANETPRIIGGIQVDPNWFSTVTSSDPLWSRINSTAKGNVLVCDLSNHGINNYGLLRARGYTGTQRSAMELAFNGSMMQLAKWPNTGFQILTSAVSATSFTYSGTRPSGWINATDPWVQGYWHYDWADDYCHVAGINTSTKTISLSTSPQYGINTTDYSSRRWYAINLLEELDSAGEYYIERQSPNSGRLYFWPTSSINGSEIILSNLGESNELLMNSTGCSNITIKGLSFESCRYDAVHVVNCNNFIIDNCIIRNTGDNGIYIAGSTNLDLRNSKIYANGTGAVSMDGGDRYNLVSSGCKIRNNEIYGFERWERTYRPGIQVSGCGNMVYNNLIYNAPHGAIMFSGNNHDFQYNTIYNVCSETSDCGAIYSGRDWGFRGNIISNNVIRDIISSVAFSGVGAHGIYLDDCFSSAWIHSNIIYNANGFGIFINGGRDNDMQNNVIAKCGVCANATSRAGTYADVTGMTNKINQFNYTQPPWSTAYPALAGIFSGHVPAIEPNGNVLARSIGWTNGSGGAVWQYDSGYGGSGGFNYYIIFWNIANQNPLFIDETNRNLALSDTSPAYTISGFGRIPFERIGLLATKASRPNPVNGKTGVSRTPMLYWAESFDPQSRDVYFGTDYTAVMNATKTSAEFKGNITNYQYAPASLNPSATYYWRIDEYNNDSAVKGDIWQFTTGL